MKSSLCPYCGRPPAAWEEASRDHVFVATLGGRVTVPCCKRCNNLIGHTIEGPLTGPNTLLRLAAGAARGELTLRGSLGPGAHPVEAKVQSGTIRFHRPVTQTGDSYNLVGTREEVRVLANEIVKRWGVNAQHVEDLLRAATPLDTGDGMVRANLVISLDKHVALICKIALGGLALAGGDDALRSDLARELRRLLAETHPYDEIERTVTTEPTAAIRDVLQNALPPDAAIEPLDATPGHGRVIFFPRQGGVALFVHVASVALPGSGMSINGRMPTGDGLPVIVEDTSGGVGVRLLVDDVMRVLAEHHECQAF